MEKVLGFAVFTHLKQVIRHLWYSTFNLVIHVNVSLLGCS